MSTAYHSTDIVECQERIIALTSSNVNSRAKEFLNAAANAHAEKEQALAEGFVRLGPLDEVRNQWHSHTLCTALAGALL
eukprot:3373492-Rhodomonas_salina.1